MGDFIAQYRPCLLPLKPNLDGQQRRPGVLYVASDGENAELIDRLLRGVRAPASWAVMAVFPRGVGEVPWSRIFHRHTLRNAMAVGETVDSMRLSDVLVALEALRQMEGVDPQRITILGRSVSGVLGLHAGILDAGVREVVHIDAPITHAANPIFLNVLRHTDVPEAAALLAPRTLKFHMRIPAAFEHTRHVYDLYGNPGAFRRVARISDEP